ncbi:TadE/TadG family type IV pilus assembly protein [Embleya sp. NPDC055664]
MELVIVTPALMLVIMLIVQFAIALHAQHVAQAAASRGLAAARADNGTAASGQARATSTLNALGHAVLQNPRVSVTRGPDRVRVVVKGTSAAVVPGLHLGVTGIAEGPVDRFVPDAPATSPRRR